MRDSVFDFASQRFENERSIISRATIAKKMGELEKDAVANLTGILDAQIRQVLGRASRDIDQGNIAAIASIDWNVAPELQRALFELWGKAWQLGQEHGIESQQKAIPPSAKKAARNRGAFSKYATLDPMTEASVRNALGMQPVGFEGTAYQRALLRRSVDLADSFSKDTLSRVMGDLLASVTPQPETGVPISRPELLERIQATIGMTEARATAIARTETTNVYNQARLETYQRGNLATYVRFLAISDSRTTEICRSRNGMVFPISDGATLADNTPPLHVHCRSVLSPLLPSISPAHEKMVADPTRSPTARTLVPLPEGWEKSGSGVTAAIPIKADIIAPDDIEKTESRLELQALIDKGDEFSSRILSGASGGDKNESASIEQQIKTLSAHRNELYKQMTELRRMGNDIAADKVLGELTAAGEKILALSENKGKSESNVYEALLESLKDRGRAVRKERGLSAEDMVVFKAPLYPGAAEVHRGLRSGILDAVNDYLDLTGGFETSEIHLFSKGFRGAAFKDAGGVRAINVGMELNKERIFHEMTHHMEFNDPIKLRNAVAFIESRATSSDPVELSELTGIPSYSGIEFAYPGKFLNPYVGKEIKSFDGEWEATEVYSMGIESFTSPERLKWAYEKDPEFVNFMIGTILENHEL